MLTIDLPEGVEVAQAWPTVPPPPEPPSYVAPQPRSALAALERRTRHAFDVERPALDLKHLMSDLAPELPYWQTSSDGRRLSRPLGNIYHDSARELDEHLLLRMSRDGRHTIAWTLQTKNGRRHRTGTFELVTTPADERPPFARLHGIETYPDVPFVDKDGSVLREVRTIDPPLEPPPRSNDDDIVAQLNDAAAWNQWRALGAPRRPARRRHHRRRFRRPRGRRPDGRVARWPSTERRAPGRRGPVEREG